MSIIKLTPRLRAAAEMAAECRRVVDVGTDHGYLPVWLAQNSPTVRVTAADIRPAPLARARASARKYDVAERMCFTLADGLSFGGAEEADCVVMAGMGGETVIGILAAAPWTKAGVRVIIQPQTKLDELCLWLSEHGYRLTDAVLAREGRRLYVVLAAMGGEANDGPLYAEELLNKKHDALLIDWLTHREALLRAALAGAERAGGEVDMTRERETLARLEILRRQSEDGNC